MGTLLRFFTYLLCNKNNKKSMTMTFGVINKSFRQYAFYLPYSRFRSMHTKAVYHYLLTSAALQIL